MSGPLAIMKRSTGHHGETLAARTCLNCGFKESPRPWTTTEVLSHTAQSGPYPYMCAACRLETFTDCTCPTCDHTRHNAQFYESLKYRKEAVA